MAGRRSAMPGAAATTRHGAGMPTVVRRPSHRLVGLALLACPGLPAAVPATTAAGDRPADTDAVETLSAIEAARLVEGFPGVEVPVEIFSIGTTSVERALPLNGLRDIDAETAAALSGYRRGPVLLNGLATLSAAAAGRLAQGTAAKVLFLNGLKRIDAETAAALAGFRGEWLDLNGLERLDPETARALAEFPGRALFLNGLAALDIPTATALGDFRGKLLHLNGLAAIDARTAAALARFQGVSLFLNGLERLSAETAADLAAFRGGLLALNGLRKVEAAALEPLRRFAGARLSVRGLTSVSAEEAAVLVGIRQWDGTLPACTAFAAPDSVTVAATLAARGDVHLPNLRRISRQALAVLRRGEGIVIPPDAELVLIAEPDGSPNDDFAVP